MEVLENALFLDQVPPIWTARAYPSLLGLTSWFVDLLMRLRELETWSTDFVVSSSECVYFLLHVQYFINPFLVAVVRLAGWLLQSTIAFDSNYAEHGETQRATIGQNVFGLRRDQEAKRRFHVSISIDRFNRERWILIWIFFVRTAPREGAYVHGMFMEGARWDTQSGIIMESRLKELFPAMPVINVRVNTPPFVLSKFHAFCGLTSSAICIRRQSHRTNKTCETCTNVLCTRHGHAVQPMCGHSIWNQKTNHRNGRWPEWHCCFKCKLCECMEQEENRIWAMECDILWR